MHICTHITYAHALHTQRRTYTPTHTLYAHKHVHTHTHTRCTYTQIDIHVHNTYTHTHAHIHTCTHAMLIHAYHTQHVYIALDGIWYDLL